MTQPGPESRPAQAPPERVDPGAWWMLFVLFLYYLLSLFDRNMITMLVEPIKADLQLSEVEMGIILGPAFAVFYALFGYPLGWAADRYPRRWVIFWGVSLWSVAAASTGLARSFWSLLACRIGVGVGEASLTPAAYSLMGDRFPRRRLTTAMSLYQTGAMVGVAGAFALGALAIDFATSLGSVELPWFGELRPWQLALIITGAPGILLALLVFTFSEPPRQRKKTEGLPPGNQFLAFLASERKLLIPMTIGFSMVVIMSNSLTAWVPTYLTRQFDWTPQQYGPMLSLTTIVSGATMVLKGWVVDWLYARGMKDAHLRFYSWLLMAGLPLALFAFLVDSPWAFILLYGALQVLIAQFVMYVAATLHMITPAEFRARTIALFLSFFSAIGLGLGPLITATITDVILGDSAKLGTSLLIILMIGIPVALVSVRYALKLIEPAMNRQEERGRLSASSGAAHSSGSGVEA